MNINLYVKIFVIFKHFYMLYNINVLIVLIMYKNINKKYKKL